MAKSARRLAALLFWGNRPAKDLTPMEKEILCAAVENDGWMIILRTNDKEWVHIGKTDFLETSREPDRRLKALEARASLIRRGYVQYEGNGERLTPKGSPIARRLCAKRAPNA